MLLKELKNAGGCVFMGNYDFTDLTKCFETERLILRVLEDSDIDFIFRQFSDLDMCKYFNVPPCESKEEAQDIINCYKNPGKEPQHRWLMVKKSDNKPVGTLGYHCYDSKFNKVEIGYDVWKEFWSQGYASEALPVLLSLCFDFLNVNRVYATLDPENVGSERLLVKYGFSFEGILRESEKVGDRYIDIMYMSLLRREFNRNH